MATDRIICWQDVTPSVNEIAVALADYMGDDIGRVQWNDDSRWYVFLPGESSHPQQRLLPGGPTVTMRIERDFEVVPGSDSLSVITRDQSPLVQAIADGFVKFAVAFWKARLEEEG